MQVAAALREPAFRFEEPVRSLLRSKGNVIWSVAPDTTVYRAIELMAEKHIGCLLVLHGGRLSGIVSERDYARKVILLGRNSMQTLVREIMSKPVLFATPEQTVDEAMRIMTNHRIRHLPVLQGEDVLGVLSIGDLVNWVLTWQQRTIQHLEGYIAGKYPA